MAENFFGNIFDTLKTAATSVVTSIEDIPQEWHKQVNELKAKATNFMSAFSNLSGLAHIAARDPVTKSQYDALMARGMAIKVKIENVTRAIDGMYGAASSMFNGVSGLGVLPLVPIAIVAGAVATVSVWLIDARSMSEKLQAARAAGASPAQITSIATGGGASKFMDTVTGGSNLFRNAGIFLVIGAGIYLLLPVIKNALKER